MGTSRCALNRLSVGAAVLAVLAGLAGPAAARASTTSVAHRFGVVDDRLATDTAAQMDADLAQDASLGVSYVRAQLNWANAEPTYGVYNWTKFDTIVSTASAHHLTVLALIDFTPAWATVAGCAVMFCAPADPAQFASFAQTAARRYGSRGVHTWEVWNEPNLAAFWAPAADPAAYSVLLTKTAAAIRAVDRSATIISGGLAPAPDANGNVAPRTFVSGLCSSGALGSVDAVGMHPYSYPVLPNYPAEWNAWQQMGSTSVSLRSIMTSCGAGAKQIWATEYGAPTNGPGAQATVGNYNLSLHPDHVSEDLQAQMATQSVADTKATAWLGGLFWYSAQDRGVLTTTNENFFGMRHYDGTPKPAWSAFEAALAR